jgi:ABC-type multidrug transport system fused ATPase/permease subunit
VIAHRLSTIEKADVIMVMDAGKHRRARQPCRADRPLGGHYTRLHAMQFREQGDDAATNATV